MSSNIFQLAKRWQAEVDSKLNNIARNAKHVGALSSDVRTGITGCSGESGTTTSHYCSVANRIVRNTMPRGKAWIKVSDKECFWEAEDE